MNAKRKKGRPLKGKLRRVRMSFTLSPELNKQIKLQSKRNKETISDLIEAAILRLSTETQDAAQILKAFLKFKADVKPIVEKYNISKLSLFGSMLHQNDKLSSDVDLLVVFQDGYTPGLFDLTTLETELSKLFAGRKVDLRTPSDLSKYFRDQVLQEAVTIYTTSQYEK